MTKLILSSAVLIALMLAAPVVRAQSGYDLFQKALATERADGNLRGAIQLYERVVKDFPGDRALVARALVRIAECHEKLGQRDAAKFYERVLREFADQAESVTFARARLGAMQSPVAATVQTTRELWKGPDVDAMGTPSADGRYLSFTDWVTGDLAVRDLAEGTSRRLTNTGGWEASSDYAEFSLLSPDGRQVAYAWFTDQSPKSGAKCVCRYDLRVMSIGGADGGRPRVLLGVDSPSFWIRPAAWMPDGKGLLIVRETDSRHHDLALLSLADSSVRSLKSLGAVLPERVTVSADGQTAALDLPASDDSPAYDIVLLNISTGQQSVAVQNPAHDHAPMFTLDGRHLLFLSDRTGTNSLWRLAMANGKPAGDPVLVSTATINSDLLGVTRSGAVYYSTGGASNNIFVARLDERLTARGTPALAVERNVNSNTGATLSPDGGSLAYVTRRASSRSGTGAQLMIHSFATNQDRQIPMRVAPEDGVSWFPDGRSVIIAARELQAREFGFYRVDLATGELELLTKTHGMGLPARRPQLSPDGRQIFFAEALEAAEMSRLVRFDLDTRQEVELRAVKRPEYITSIGVSRDGADVALLRFDGPMSILEIMPAAGGPSREVFREKNLTGARFSGLAWSADKRYVVFVRNANGAGAADKSALWKVPVAGGTPEPMGITFDGIMRLPSLDQANSRIIYSATGGGDFAIMSVENFLPKQ